ncbi:MAG: hypothetical protein UR89_C0033G0002 [Candidatus Roizmanbacteria bacterium GW2011_GWA2_35_8]|uniref:Uncharacterized protein n=1 Tax=Candidatus Roizmanbacteria bacterium GW2011_GWA2_35_8 TaxID=1618479 RepID=A0A0G0CW81_9BACT|nr:MAG: hypothetical protein UR89_C0033G0002 [Candidatus Roizmanbacteria bacterium GW2011_GWA2_35_8]
MTNSKSGEGLKKFDTSLLAMKGAFVSALLGLVSGGVMMATKSPEVAQTAQNLTVLFTSLCWGLTFYGGANH